MIKVLLLHAYSRSNKGDGLLVDLSCELIREAFGADTRIDVIAGDATSFSDLDNVCQMPGQGFAGFPLYVQLVKNAFFVLLQSLGIDGDLAGLRRRYADVDIVCGVGGGYLRADYLRAVLGAGLIHLPQLMLANSLGKPTFYFSQSIGPFAGIVGRMVRGQLSKLNCVCVRDDRSHIELESFGIVSRRFPDLAAMRLSTVLDEHKDCEGYKKIYLIARDLQNKSSEVRNRYIQRICILREALPNVEVVCQSRGRGNDDQDFYSSLGWGDVRDVKHAIASDGPGVMISVRLHGALEAMIAGCPTIHITYERKGFGAFDDLGVRQYLHLATDFDPNVVINQAIGLAGGDPYWSLIRENKICIDDKRRELVAALRSLAVSQS